MTIKYLNQEKTYLSFNDTFLTLVASDDWDSIGDGPTREAVKAWIAAGNTPQPVDVPTLDQTKTDLCNKIDSHIADIYRKFQRFSTEYETREAAAKAYVATDPTTQDASIQEYAKGAGKTYADAVTTVLSQASSLRDAVKQLGVLRMKKYSIKSAVDEASATTIYNDVILQSDNIAAML